jgi:glycosyltransferase involved in cell wall biosynthesis
MSKQSIAIITPCYNESIFVIKFLERLEATLAPLPYSFTVVAVNDRSTDNTLALLKCFEFNAPNLELHVISLKFNSGHQGAIYQGFLYARTLKSKRFIVMDSDGEDSPSAIPELLKYPDADIINVVRNKRRESLLFKFFYAIYKVIFKGITGKQMNFGNFCLISRSVLEHACSSSFTHLAAFLSRQKYATNYIMADKDARIGGESKMGFNKLFYHAFKSFVEYAEDLLMVFFKSFMVIMVALLLTIGNVVYQKFVTHTAIAGWFSIAIITLVNLAVTCIGFFVLGVLLIHLNKQKQNTQEPIYELCSKENSKELTTP